MNIPSIITYTLTDESPLLSTYSLLPIIYAFTKDSGIIIQTRDISLSARILSNFSEYLEPQQQVCDHLYELEQLIKTKYANIIKLPNISASLFQLQEAIQELQYQGYCLPDYIENPKSSHEYKTRHRYKKIIGSAVNPVLRDGNSLRYVPSLVKRYIKQYPMQIKSWSPLSKSHVASMQYGDFCSTEKSQVITKHGSIKIILSDKYGVKRYLKEISVNNGDIIDTAYMSKSALVTFIKQQIQDAKRKDILFSVHLKATMMKISDPIIFGIIVYEFYKDVLNKYDKQLKELKINFNDGISDLYKKIVILPKHIQNNIKLDIELLYKTQPKLAMIDHIKGITNLHVPNGMIIDASMSSMIRNGGKMFGGDGKLHDTKAIIPDRYYANVYQTIIDNCKMQGAFNSHTMGSMNNIGLMAKKSEEYGSHNTTFKIPIDGIIEVVNNDNEVLFQDTVHVGDIWRLCQTQDIAIQNWINLTFDYMKQNNNIPIVFWLDKERPHDMCIINKIQSHLISYYSSRLNVSILSPVEASLFSIDLIRSGHNVISVTGNVLRDYLTDLFPILELGMSSRICSVVKLISGGMLFETGAGGSAPKHMEQFIKKNHLRWDSLGEFFALVASLKHIYFSTGNTKVKILFETLNKAIDALIKHNKLPLKKITELDTRGSHFYLALYWAKYLTFQNINTTLQVKYKSLYEKLVFYEHEIISKLIYAQGKPIDIGGYYHPNINKIISIMRPCHILNNIFQEFMDL